MRKVFCFICDKLPTSITINKTEIAINSDVATALSVLLYLQDDTKSNYEKIEYFALKLFGQPYNKILDIYKCTPAQLDTVMLRFLDGAPKLKKQANKKTSDKNVIIPDFDFEQDSGAIIASFRKEYNISVEEIQKMHWWEFLALFQNITGDNAFCNIRHIRNMEIDKHDSKERQAEIRKAKQDVALVNTREKENTKINLDSLFD